MTLADRWDKTSRNKKAWVFLFIGIVTAVCFILGLLFTDEGKGSVGGEEASGGTIFDKCKDYETIDSVGGSETFSVEGVTCDNCQKVGKNLFFQNCSNSCEEWVLEPATVSITPIESSCDFSGTPTIAPEPTDEYECPEGFYTTTQSTGCIADSIDDINALLQVCLLLGEDPTLEECFDTCESLTTCEGCDSEATCAGVAVASDGSSCFVITDSAEHLCDYEVIGSTVCTPIEPNFECFDDKVDFFDAEEACMDRGYAFAARPDVDEFDIQIQRLSEECETSSGCFFETNTSECFFVLPDGSFGQDPLCDEQRGYCCEIPTGAPTLSPTSSPTPQVFFIPECQDPEDNSSVFGLFGLGFEDARECCLENGADLASIHSQDEQDFAWDVCTVALDEAGNDCGCWNGLNRIDQPVSIDPEDFFWTDGSPNDFFFFEGPPNDVQPDNTGDRNEECVHMRPFTDGGWNDLPCSGECDAIDTRPFPLCRLFTPAPTTSPTLNPTANPTTSPTKNPTTSPTKNPTISPTRNPTVSPTRNPTTSPSVSPTESPTKNPTTSPTKNPTNSPTSSPSTSPTVSPTENPTTSPTTSPTDSPTKSPTTSPSTSPTTSPTKNPTTSPTKNPTASPTESPTVSPTINPTTSPTKSPTESPTRNPTESPTKSPTGKPTTSPTVSPTGEPTTSPTDSPTVSPTKNPTTSPTQSPTESPTTSPTESPTTSPTESPTKNPTVSPTKSPSTSPTDSPTKNPTSSPTESPTKNPTVSPTRNPTTSPTDSPTQNPTSSPTISPTRNPTGSPTTSPTRNPTTSPTKNPTVAPTLSPIAAPPIPDPKCTFNGEEYIWEITNFHYGFELPFLFYFENPNGRAFYPGKDGVYPDCTFSLCSSYSFQIPGFGSLEFATPTKEAIAVYPCDIDDPRNCEIDLVADDNVIECTCPVTEYFEDGFEDYPITNALTESDSPEFFDSWFVDGGNVDVIGLLKDDDGNLILDSSGDPIPSNSFNFNPCQDTACIDIDGSVKCKHVQDNTLGIRDIELEPNDAFYNRICTLNFYARGNGRCGSLHDFNSDSQAERGGCLRRYRDLDVPLSDDLTVEVFDNGTSLIEVAYEDIPWDQDWEQYGVTADVSNLATSVFGAFNVIGKDDGEGGNIGPLLDDVDITCCCPIPEDEYIARVIDVDQGPTEDGSTVPDFKSDYQIIPNHVPSYDDKHSYALGLGGYIVLEFGLGASGYVYIYEESYVCCCCDDYDPEDAIVEVSVDGINWLRVKDSFKGEWEIFSGGDESIRRSKVWLPNGACFKYIKIIDNSDTDCLASDGFDLISVQVEEPCCPTDYPLLTTAAPTSSDDVSQNRDIGEEVSGVSIFLFVVAAMGCVLLALLTGLTLYKKKQVEEQEDPEADMRKLAIDEEEPVANNEPVANKAI